MEGDIFAHSLACWLQPGIIARVAEEVGTAEADEIIHVQFRSNVFQSAHEVGLDKLFGLYLDNFHVPQGLVDIARFYRLSLPQAAWDEVCEIRFTGTCSFEPKTIGSIAPGAPPVMQVAEVFAPLREARLFQWPLAMLTDAIGSLARYWKGVLKSGAHVHHEHRAEWPFLAFVDLTVARSLNFPEIGRSGMGVKDRVYSFGYTHSGVATRGPLPIEKDTLSFYRDNQWLMGQMGGHYFVDPSRK